MFHTLGQRQGLGIGGRTDAGDAPWYVLDKRPRRQPPRRRPGARSPGAAAHDARGARGELDRRAAAADGTAPGRPVGGDVERRGAGLALHRQGPLPPGRRSLHRDARPGRHVRRALRRAGARDHAGPVGRALRRGALPRRRRDRRPRRTGPGTRSRSSGRCRRCDSGRASYTRWMSIVTAENRTLALAGVFQAVYLCKDLATSGTCDEEDLGATLRSILTISNRSRHRRLRRLHPRASPGPSRAEEPARRQRRVARPRHRPLRPRADPARHQHPAATTRRSSSSASASRARSRSSSRSPIRR